MTLIILIWVNVKFVNRVIGKLETSWYKNRVKKVDFIWGSVITILSIAVPSEDVFASGMARWCHALRSAKQMVQTDRRVVVRVEKYDSAEESVPKLGDEETLRSQVSSVVK